MRLHRISVMAFLMAGIVISAVWADEEDSDVSVIHAQIFGKGAFEFGQIVDGQYSQGNNNKLSHYALEKADVKVGGEIKRNDGLSVVVVGEGKLSFPYALPTDGASSGGFQCYSPRYTWDLFQANAHYSFGDPEKPFLSLGAGYFPFKYNPDARTFGDYLFRISPYPQFLQTCFDMPYSKLLGIHLGSTLFSSLRQDLLLTSETVLWPLRDFSLSYLISYNLFQCAEFGWGIMLDRLLSVDEKLTTPPKSTNTNEFTFRGTKMEFRCAIDLKRFLPFYGIFGKNDLRFYYELCLNGFNNYPITDPANASYPGYNSSEHRIPIVVGLNIPTFNFLEVLSVEFEWWDNNFANSYWGVFNAGYAMPPNPYKYQKTNRSDPYGGPWHWSVYAKKNIIPNLNFVGQVARDHSFIETSQTGLSNGDPQEAVDGLGNWMWICKLEFGI